MIKKIILLCSECGNKSNFELNSRYATRKCHRCGSTIMIEQCGGCHYVQAGARPRPRVKVSVIFLLALLIAQPANAGSVIDVDGNGRIGALTDGILISRYLFDFRGKALIEGAVSATCTRCTADSITRYLSTIDKNEPPTTPYIPGCRWQPPSFICPPVQVKMDSAGNIEIKP